jgi:hypothetical protein
MVMGTLQGQTYSQRMNITLAMLVPEKQLRKMGSVQLTVLICT